MKEKCLVITVEKTEEAEANLIKLGYEKRSGGGAYPWNNVFIQIVPQKKWYWEIRTATLGTHIESF